MVLDTLNFIFDNGNFKAVIATIILLLFTVVMLISAMRKDNDLLQKMVGRLMIILGMVIAFYFGSNT